MNNELRTCAVAVGTALILVAGILLGANLSEDQPVQPAQSEQSIVVGQEGYPQTSIERIPAASPEATLLLAIDMMKFAPKGEFSIEAAVLADQLQWKGYYPQVTYPDGSEQLNYELGDTFSSTDDVEILVNYNGIILDAAIFGEGTMNWSVFCPASPSSLSTVDYLDYLVNKTRFASRWWNADTDCRYLMN